MRRMLGALLFATTLASGPVEAYERGQWTRALARATAAPEHDASRLVAALAAFKLDRHDTAVAAIDALHEHGPSLGQYGTHLQVLALTAAKRCQQSHERATQVASGSVFAAPSWARVSACWLRAGNAAAAHAAAELTSQTARTDDLRAHALLLEARAALAAEQEPRAVELYRQVVTRYPASAARRQADGGLESLRERRGADALDPDELLELADSELDYGRALRAQRLYRGVLARRGSQPADAVARATLGLVELDLVAQRYGRALQSLADVLEARVDDSLMARALYLEGDILLRRANITAGLESLSAAVDRYPESPFALEAALMAARAAYHKGDVERAQALSQWLVEQPTVPTGVTVVSGDGARTTGAAGGDPQGQAWWLLGWMHYQARAWEMAVAAWSNIELESPLAPRALYWRLRLAHQAGRDGDIDELWSVLTTLAPTSFYALSAADLIAAERPACPIDNVGDAATRTTRPALEAEDLEAVVTLWEHGLRADAWRLVRSFPATVWGTADRLVAAWMYRCNGDVHRAALITRRAVGQAASELRDPALFALSFPTPFAEVVEENAARYGLPPELIYAVMREESGFNPRARSPRNARGLMQMIPSTAVRMAHGVGLRAFHLRRLYEPEVSVRLGAHYLANLLEEFGGDLVSAVAAYHAGERAVRRWRAARPSLSPAELLEDIPYETTRTYVTKVLGSLGLYRVLYAPQSTRWIALEPRGPSAPSASRVPRAAAF